MDLEELQKIYPKYSGVPGNRFKDISGEKYGKISILYRAEDERGNDGRLRTKYVCKCDCGNIFIRKKDNLKNKPDASCGKCKDFIFKQKEEIGDFYIINTFKNENDGNRECCTLKCKKCEYIFYPRKSDLYNKDEYKCIKCNSFKTNNTFKIGDKIGKLLLLSFQCNDDNKIRWKCRCDCGNEIELGTTELHGRKSCGNCIDNGKDIIGNIFGKLTVLEVLPEQKNHNYIYKCQCECGNYIEAQRGNLLSGHTKSCGCAGASYHEYFISELLKTYNIPFLPQYTDNSLKSDLGKNLRFDFYINNNYIIEYDGAQHFKYSKKGWNIKETYEKTHNNDLIKNKYCFDHNIPLIRIPYNADYTIDDLKLETTRFLLTPENEAFYYEMCSKQQEET